MASMELMSVEVIPFFSCALQMLYGEFGTQPEQSFLQWFQETGNRNWLDYEAQFPILDFDEEIDVDAAAGALL